MKRFYKDTAVAPVDGGYQVLLDGWPMRTPAKAVLLVPTEPLTTAIAEEWRAVPEQAEINVSHLPLTRLAATGVDRVSTQRKYVIDETAKYGASDLLCYRATDPVSLVQRQADVWQPLLDWAAERYGATLAVTAGTSFVSQPHAALAALRGAVTAHSDFALSALFNLTHITGSLVIGLAVSEGRIDAAQAFAAGQLDELYQIEKWGADPLATERHDGIRRDLEAATRFIGLLGDTRLKGRA